MTMFALASGPLADPARADGDPASDVLVSQPLFLPQDAGVPASQQAQLSALLAAAQRSGYKLRVALIASRTDLGSVTELWRQPQNYARFVGQELSLIHHGPLLVVMPNGYGLYRPHRPLDSEQTALTGIPPPGSHLGTATLTAIRRLAATSGHNLPAPTAATPPNPESNDTLPWIAFAIGSILILLAWIASLRARPISLCAKKISSP